MKIYFLNRRGNVNKTGLTPLRCRFTLEKQRKQYSAGIFINSDLWSQEKPKVLDTGENTRTKNPQLSLIKQKFRHIGRKTFATTVTLSN